MANTVTMYSFEIAISDSDRNVYEDVKVSVALQPSETLEFMAMRVLAYCLEYEEFLSFSKGLADPEEPAIWAKQPDGRIKAWIEVGVPDPNKLHKAAKNAERVCVYAHRNPSNLLKSPALKRVYRGDEIKVITVEPAFLSDFSSRIVKRNVISLSVGEKHLYLNIGGTTLEGFINEVPLIGGSG